MKPIDYFDGIVVLIKLSKIFDLLGNDTFVSVKEGEKEIYSGECGKMHT